MEIFTCTYENHENEVIMGFCLNPKCQNQSQFCFKCLMKLHSDHQDDCIRFTNIPDLINQYISYQGNIIQQANQIYNQIKNLIQLNIKKIEDNALILKDFNSQLMNQDYLKFKQSIFILKQYYSLDQQKKGGQLINKLDELLEVIQNSEKNDGKHHEIEITFEKAKQLTNEGKHEDAILLYDKSLFYLNKYDEIFRWKSQSLLYLQKISQGIQCCDIATQLNPKNDMAINNKGWALQQLNEHKQAIECYDKAIQLNLKNDSAFENKGWALHQLNQYKEAIECYDKAIQLNPKNDLAFNNKGLALKELKQYKEVIECCEKAIQLNPKNDLALINKGQALHQLNQYKQAVECYEKAILLNPNNNSAFINKGLALYELKQYKEAIECYDKAIQLNPNNDLALINKGQALYELKQYKVAILFYDKAIQLNPKIANAYHLKANSLHEMKQFQKAVEFYDRALLLNEHPNTFECKANSLLALGKKFEAKQCYQNALNAGSKNKEYIIKQIYKL